MNLFSELLLNIRGLRISDELSYLFDLLVGVFSRRLLRLPTFPGCFLPRDVRVIVRNKENTCFYCQARTDALFHVMPYYERDTWKVMKSIVMPGDVCIDVGAHIGTYTIPLARIVGPNGLVVAVEPSSISKVLSLNAELNKLKNILILDKAAYSERKLLNFYFTSVRSACASLHKDWISNNMKMPASRVKVKAMPLDELLAEAGWQPNEVKLLKIDVENTEREVLQGAHNTLKITKFVVFEASQRTIRDCTRILKSAGFKVTLLEKSPFGVHNFLATK